MTITDLIFDWRRSESSFRDKVFSLMVVIAIFTIFFVFVSVRISSSSESPSESAKLLRFRNDELGRFWMLQAEEDGPFPGRLELDGYKNSLSAGGIDGLVTWSDYRSELRPMSGGDVDTRENLAAKGTRVFPTRGGGKSDAGVAVPRKIGRMPVIFPYDSQAIGWMPDEMPDFNRIQAAEILPATWRFILNLREDGTVRESISIGGGDDAGQTAIQGWLQAVHFKKGSGDRWFGVRVELVNQISDGTDAE